MRASHLDGSILIMCEVEFIPYNLNVEIADEPLFVVNTLQNSIKNMFKQETLSDCVIKIGKDKINAHRCILAQNSQVFLRMFEQKGMVEAEKGVVKIVDTSP
uniref:BTB domain-containing protein n=1 Tax=Meloidogyne incognita TaxID=6306 RepID=A0A914MT01_MELIC